MQPIRALALARDEMPEISGVQKPHGQIYINKQASAILCATKRNDIDSRVVYDDASYHCARGAA